MIWSYIPSISAEPSDVPYGVCGCTFDIPKPSSDPSMIPSFTTTKFASPNDPSISPLTVPS